MKRAVVLHGTGSSHANNWFPWVKKELEKLGYEVWVPDLPDADRPNIKRYNEFLLNQGWDFNDNLIIGHSSGSVEILGLLQALPDRIQINTAILIGSFDSRLTSDPKWETLKGLFEEPFDYKKITKKAKQFIFIHSDNDPYCPIEQARELHQKIGGEFIMLPGQQHFSYHLDPKYERFPDLIEIVKEKVTA